MNNATFLLAITALLVATNTGCERSNATGNADEAPAAVHGELRVSHDAQAAIGIAIAVVKPQNVGNSIVATGWLAARPASEVIVKAPAVGFLTPGKTIRSLSVTPSLRIKVSPNCKFCFHPRIKHS